MARTFEIMRKGNRRWTEVVPGDARKDDIVRVKDSGTVVDAILPVVSNDPQVYFVVSDGTISPVSDPDTTASVKIGVTILHPDGGYHAIPLATP